MRRSVLHDESDSTDSKQQLKRFTFYVFIDQLLGQGCGREFLRLQTQQICFILEDEGDRTSLPQKKLKYDIHVYFYDVHDQKRMEIALQNLKFSTESKSRKIRVMICGDQSTLGLLVGLADDNDVPIQNIPIGMIPSGQFNDLSAVLGWGNTESQDIVGQDLKYLKMFARKWTKAVIERIDSWNVQIQTCEDGEIQVVNRVNKTKVTLEQKILRQVMIAHTNIGVHARISLGFQVNKGETGFGNKCVQAYEQFKKMMCMSTPKVDKMVSLVEIRIDPKDPNDGDRQTYRTLFSAKQQNANNPQNKYLDSPVSLACLNIDTYRGIHQVWKNSSSDSPRHSFSSQSYHDGKLQFVTFSSTVTNSSQKMCQSDGNVQIRMQRHQPAYVQIDNVPYKLAHPKTIRVSRGKRLQVLINKESLMIL